MSGRERVLVVGSTGFVGRNVRQVLERDNKVFGAARGLSETATDFPVDLTDSRSIEGVLAKSKPDIIVNCAGIVGRDGDFRLNATFTVNLLKVVVALGLPIRRFVVSGSAAAYGLVAMDDMPVNEMAALQATGEYGLSKIEEEIAARRLAKEHDLSVVIARIFNPIGLGMNEKLLLPQLISQVAAIEAGTEKAIELNRLDTKRDYLHVSDVAEAIRCIALAGTCQNVYNIGSGKSTSNGELLDAILTHSRLKTRPEVREALPNPEPLMAIQADITRIQTDFGWVPTSTMDEAIKEIMHGARQ